MQLTRPRKVGLAVLSAIATIVLSTASSCSPPSAADQDAANSAANTGQLQAQQPVEAGKYSTTREQINNWTRVWGQAPGKLAYTYLFRQGVDEPLGYYVLVGPPVSYAANSTQPYTPKCESSTGCYLLANPGQDGAYYNQGSGTNQFYGKDAQSGRQLEWGGDGISYLLSDQPLKLQAPALGDAVIGQGKLAGK